MSTISSLFSSAAMIADSEPINAVKLLEDVAGRVEPLGSYEAVGIEKSHFTQVATQAANALFRSVKRQLAPKENSRNALHAELDLAIAKKAVTLAGGFNKRMDFTEQQFLELSNQSKAEWVQDHFEFVRDAYALHGRPPIWMPEFVKMVEEQGGPEKSNIKRAEWEEVCGVPYPDYRRPVPVSSPSLAGQKL